jgi:dUTP pyrophosphatase
MIFEFASDEARSLYNDKPPLPVNAFAAGIDLRTTKTISFPLGEGGYEHAPSGIKMAIPPGLCGLVMPRSSLYKKTGCLIPNSPGVIDSDYRGEIQIPLLCNIIDSITIPAGTRIAQLLFSFASQHTLAEGDLRFMPTDRGEDGFGSTD